MRNHEIASPNAAELYFNDSIVGHVCMLLAEALGGLGRRKPVVRKGGSHAAPARPVARPAEAPRRSWLDRLDAWFWRQEQRDREAYLARSRDVFDLEQRMAALDRNGVPRYY